MNHIDQPFMDSQSSNTILLTLLLYFIAAFATTAGAEAQIRSTGSGGIWHDGATWVGGNVPTETDDVIITGGSEVSFQSQGATRNLTVEAGATLTAAVTQVITVHGNALNQGSIVGENGHVEVYGNVTNQGTWTSGLYFGGSGIRTLMTAGVEGDQWVSGDVTLVGYNEMAKLDHIGYPDGLLTVDVGATLRLVVAPNLSGYSPDGLSLPDSPNVVNHGTIVVRNAPGGFFNTVIGSDFGGQLSAGTSDELWVETHADQAHPGFPQSIRQWLRLEWEGSDTPPTFTAFGLFFDATQLNGLDTSDLYVHHSSDGGSTWTRLTNNPVFVLYDPQSGEGYASVATAPGEGDYVIAGPDGPMNRAPVAVDDRSFTLEGKEILVPVLANDYDPDGNAIRIVSATDGSGGTTSIDGDEIRYSPTGAFTGEDTFTYTITDDVAGDAGATVTIRVASNETALFSELGPVEMNPTEGVVRRRVGQLNLDHIQTLASSENGLLTLNLFDDVVAVMGQTGSKNWSQTESSWFGASDRFGDWVTYEFDSADPRFFATAWVEGIPYRIERQQDGSYGIEELDLSNLIDDVDIDVEIDTSAANENLTLLETWVHEAAGKRPAANAAVETPGSAIDVLVLFTTDAAAAAGGQAAMRQEIFNAVNNTNQTYRNSGINAVLRLAGTAMVLYNEQTDSAKDLTNLTADGQRDDSDVAELRNQYAADVVGLVASTMGKNQCGRAHIMDPVSVDHEKKAFFVLPRGNCLGGNLSFSHEIGHIQGARHDRFVDPTDGSPYSFNHGYVNPPGGWTSGVDQWRTVMAYNTACSCSDEASPCPSPEVNSGPNCSRLMFWSSPNLTGSNGFVMGVASGSSAADNVRTLNTTASTVSAFRGARPAVSGTITDISTGAGLANVSINAISTNQGYSTLSDSAGFYALLVPSGTTLSIIPSRDGYVFDPVQATASNVTSDVVQNFDASPLFTVSGSIQRQSVGVSDVTITAPPYDAVVTGASGEFSLTLPWDYPGAITPYHEAYDFIPSSVSFDTLRADTLNISVTATFKQFSINGHVQTLSGQSVQGVVLEGLPGNPATDSNGRYGVVVTYGWAGSARPVLAGYNFEPYERTYVSVSSSLTHDYDAYPGGLARSEWPMWSSAAAHGGTLDIATFSNSVVWSATMQGRLNPPVVGQDGTVYASTSSRVYAIASDGTPIWNLPLPGASETSPAAGTAGRLYVAAGGMLIAFDTYAPSQEWTFSTGGAVRSAPAIDGVGNIYVGSNSDKLFAVSPGGAELWAFSTGGDVHSSPALSPAGNVYFGSDDGYVYAVDSNGTELWRYDTGGAVRSSPTLGGGSLYIGTDADALVALDASTGSERWRYNVGGDVRATPALGSDGKIYFGAADGIFYALTSTGQLDWSYDTGNPISASAAVSYTRVRTLSGNSSDEEVVYVANEGSLVLAFNIRTTSAAGDRLRWQYPGATLSPVLTESGLLTGTEFDSASRLDALEPESRALVQISVLLNDFGANFDPDKLAAMLWFDEAGGPLALFPDASGDPCTGGPLVIPNCPLGDTFGQIGSLVTAPAGRELFLGLAEYSEFLQDVVNGTSTEGLLKTFPITFDPYDVASVVIGGLLDPTGYAANPDGLSTDLSVFQTEYSRDAFSGEDNVFVGAGNLSTDASALSFILSGAQQFSFDGLNFGGLSDLLAVPAGIYDFQLLSEIPGKNGSRVLQQSTLDLSDRAGELVTIYATGFMDPASNNSGPGLGVLAASGEGDVLVAQSLATRSPDIPSEMVLQAVYPNPLSGAGTVFYEIPSREHVRMEVFDILGRRVSTILNDIQEAGASRVRLDVSNLSSGIYLLRMTAADAVISRKFAVVR